MLTSLKLTNFRGFQNLEIPKLTGVNLIGGVNNAGKTGLLEAIYVLLERDQNRLKELPNLFRAKSEIDEAKYFWRWLTRNGSKTDVTTIDGDLGPFGRVQLHWLPTVPSVQGQIFFQVAGRMLTGAAMSKEALQKWPQPEVFSPRPTKPVEDAQVYIQAAKKSPDSEERIEALLREVEPRLKRVRVFPDEKTNQPLVHIGLDFGEMLPSPQLGQGFNRLLRIYSALIGSEAKVFLIDEVETGLHHSVLPTIWKGLAAVARQEKVQIFATTHSRETILAAHRVFSQERNYDFAYHRLERENGKISVVTYDQESLAGADEANFEVR